MKPKKVPEQTTEDKLKFYKNKINGLEKEIGKLRTRFLELEKRMDRLSPKKVKQKKTSDEKRREILERFHPDHRKED